MHGPCLGGKPAWCAGAREPAYCAENEAQSGRRSEAGGETFREGAERGESVLLESWNEWVSVVSRETLVFLTAMMPVVELRGAIPLGISLGMNPVEACAVAVLGNIVPVVPVMLFLRYAAAWLQRFQSVRRASEWFFARTRARSGLVQKYGPLGLVLFVAVPLPSTGAWTAAVAAFLFGIGIRKAFIAISLGTALAGLIVTGLTCHVIP